MTEPLDVASLAAVVARQSLDLNLYASFLMVSLVDSLGSEFVQVQRSRSLADRMRGREPQVVSAAVTVGDERYTLARPNSTARPSATVSHVVGGIVLRTEPVALDVWSVRLAAALRSVAENNQSAAAALARITATEL